MPQAWFLLFYWIGWGRKIRNMMNNLFYEIVKLFRWICLQTGLSYEELNILVYCLLVPFSWLVLAFIRTKRYVILLLINVLCIFCFLYYREMMLLPNSFFYHKNIKFLELVGGKTLQGYITASLIVGLIVPFAMYFLLLTTQKSYLSYLLISYFLGLCVYFGFVFLIF